MTPKTPEPTNIAQTIILQQNLSPTNGQTTLETLSMFQTMIASSRESGRNSGKTQLILFTRKMEGRDMIMIEGRTTIHMNLKNMGICYLRLFLLNTIFHRHRYLLTLL